MTKTRIDRLRTEQRSIGDRQRIIECFISIDKQQHKQQQQHDNITDFTRAGSLFFYIRTIVVFVDAANLIR